MKNRMNILTTQAMLATALLLLPASCIKDDYAARKNATVTMTFTTRANSNPQAPETGQLPAEDNKRMKTLRVIVARKATGEILYNDKYIIQPEERSKTINYSELTVQESGEDFDFYAIANEESFNASTSLEGKGIDVNQLQQRLIKMGVNSQTNGLMPNQYGLPQADFMSINVSAQNNEQQYDMPLQFAVAKARVTFLNTTKVAQTVSNVQLENVQPANTSSFSTPLFRDEQLSGTQAITTGSRNVNLGNVADIPAQTGETPGSKVVNCYFYETTRGTDPYKLTAEWEDKTWEIDLDDEAIAAINRGQMLDIKVTLIKKEGLKVSWTVKDWEADDDMGLEFTSEFNGSLTGQLIKTYTDETTRKEYVAVAEGQDSQQAERYAQFRFVMTSPVGGTWTAHLSDGDNFEFVGPYSGNGVTQEEATQGQGVVTLTVKPRRAFEAGQTRTTRLYIVVNGLDGAQTINEDNHFPGDANYIDIIQISTAEYDNIQTAATENL